MILRKSKTKDAIRLDEHEQITQLPFILVSPEYKIDVITGFLQGFPNGTSFTPI
ncbi:hypothetical protein [Porphyromonas pogonae]|uniref:hypothetical protein n=1 Tax=Porphyromonas pogonae TaxID=867595 RepID=UPI002E78C4E3|nr:hypothetical protein [Porphyromonas pogonae]